MKSRAGFVVFLFLSGLLSGCGGGGGSSDPVPAPVPEPTPEEDIGAINDPFVKHQWYLYNSGQTALSASGGVLYADIQVFDSDPAINSDAVYARGFTGEGVWVAVIDNGVEIGHEDIIPNAVLNGSYNFYSENNGKSLLDPTPPITVDNPDGYHGVAVAGLAAARGGNELGIWGVSPSSELVGYNLLYSGFDLTMELAAMGVADALSQYPQLSSSNVDVFNMSYGRNPYQGTNENGPYTSEILAGMQWGTENLRDSNGALYIKAGGNEYRGGVAFTEDWCQQAINNGVTCYNVNMENENVTPYLMVIGGFNADDKRASYSNTGSALWMVGPAGEYGVKDPALITTDMSGCTYGFSQSIYDWGLPFNSSFNTGREGSGNESCHYFSAFNGTSSSTPVISGIVALLLEANPDLSWRDVKHILATTARQLDPDLANNSTLIGGQSVVLESGWVSNQAGYAFSNAYGFGAPDTNAAIDMALDWKANGTTLETLQISSPISGNVPIPNAIADANATGLSATVNVAADLVTESVELVVSIEDLGNVADDGATNKIDMSDYQIVLRSPAGTESILLTPFNAYQSGYDMVDLKLISHAFYGEPTQGNWTLIVRDLDGSTDNQISHVGEGKLTDWSLRFYGH